LKKNKYDIEKALNSIKEKRKIKALNSEPLNLSEIKYLLIDGNNLMHEDSTLL
jgi:hypothetical protein